jgi:D-serine deaminase-like pyridoxal phosphate-dependent protein
LTILDHIPGEFYLREAIDTPSLILDLDILERNLDAMSELCSKNGVSLQPHAKTHRTPEIGKLQIERGADGLCVAKLGEAEGFAKAGIKTITVGFPIIGENKALRALKLKKSTNLTLGTDSFAGAESLGKVFAANNEIINLLLIIDSGLGRDGVKQKDAAGVAQAINKIEGVNLVGVMTHEGIVYGAKDKAELELLARQAAQMMVTTSNLIKAAGVKISRVSMGASASARIVVTEPDVTQIRPGIFAFNDLGQIALGNATVNECAIRVLASVVSHTSDSTAVIDAGSKTLSQDGLPARSHLSEYPGHGMLVGYPGWILEKLSEEHGTLKWVGNSKPTPVTIGEKIQIIPNHVCTVFSSLNECVAIRDGHIQGVWRTLAPGASR